MKKLLLLPLFLLFLCTASAQKRIKTKKSKHWLDTVDRQIDLGYQEDYEKLPKLELDTISRSEFWKYKKSYHSKLDINKPGIKSADTSFIIYTSKSKLRYNKFNKRTGYKNGYWWNDYIGFFSGLKLYVVKASGMSDDLEFGQLFLIDSISNLRYNLISYDDGGVSTPIVSPGNKYFITYSNCVACPDQSSFIGVTKINFTNNRFTYHDFASFESQEWLIEDVVWISDNSFALKVQRSRYDEEKRKWITTLSYLKSSLPI